MNDSPILQGLNEAQRAAVSAPVGPVLVLAELRYHGFTVREATAK
jgi:hypothetical protein